MREKWIEFKKSRYFGRVIAFAIPFMVSLALCVFNGVYPFGDRCLLHVDMYHQYCPFFTELMRKLKSGSSLMYSWNIGLGSDFISVFVYYLSSPLNLLLWFCPKNHVIEFMSLLILGKTAFAGCAFFWYLQEHFHLEKVRERNGERFYMALAFSTAYAMSGFMTAYSWNIMWLDSVALFPLVLLGAEKLVNEKKPMLYYITLALSIWSNYYISMMICMFLAGYCVMLLISAKEKPFQGFVRFAWYSLLAGGTSGVLIIPEYKILSYSGSAGISFPKDMKWYTMPWNQIARGFTTVSDYTGAEHWPNLYAGAFVFLLLFLCLFNKRIGWKQKVAGGLLLVFFYVSFANNYLDFIWHGFHFPDSLPGRQSFLFIFVVLVFAFVELWNWSGTKLWHIGAASVLAVGFCLMGFVFAPEEAADIMALVITLLFILGYGLIGALIKITGREHRIMFKRMFIFLAIAEVVVHSSINGFYTISRTSYVSKFDLYPKLLELAKEDALEESGVNSEQEVFYRLEDTERMTKNDDALYGYKSATQFSSLMNINVSHLFQSVYMEGGKNFYSYNGATPIISALMSVKYFVSEEILPQSPLRSLVGTRDNHYLYKNIYCLPPGIVVDKNALEQLNLISGEKTNGINKLSRAFGYEGDTLLIAQYQMEAEAGCTTITIEEEGYFYADNSGCSSDTLTICDEYGKRTEYSKTTHKYLFDLGYYKKGDVIRIKNAKQESIDFQVYRLNMAAVDSVYDKLDERTLKEVSYTDTKFSGKVEAGKEGILIFSVPKEAGWSAYMDGERVVQGAFEDTWIAIPVDEKEHRIDLVYETPGLRIGAGVSVICLLLLLITNRLTMGRQFYYNK